MSDINIAFDETTVDVAFDETTVDVDFDDVQNLVWRDGATDNIIGVATQNAFPDDVGYICDEAALLAAYAAENTLSAASTLTFRRQCNDGETTWPPTSLAHLKGIPLADWSFSDCDSDAVDDYNWDRRGYYVGGTEGTIQPSGLYRVAQTGQVQSLVGFSKSMAVGSLSATLQREADADFLHNLGFSITIGGVIYGIYAFQYGGSSNWLTVTRNGAPQVFLGMFPDQQFSGEIRWDGAFVRCRIYDVERYFEANAGGQTGFMWAHDLNTNFGPGGAVSALAGSFALRDAAIGGDLVYNSLVGAPCS